MEIIDIHAARFIVEDLYVLYHSFDASHSDEDDVDQWV
jgi:hypothetical protein